MARCPSCSENAHNKLCSFDARSESQSGHPLLEEEQVTRPSTSPFEEESLLECVATIL